MIGLHKSYELWLHWKQGDEFGNLIEEADSTEDALTTWAKIFESRAEHCRKLAEVVDGKDIEGYGDTHHIDFRGDEEVLEEAVEKDLLQLREIPEYDDEIG